MPDLLDDLRRLEALLRNAWDNAIDLSWKHTDPLVIYDAIAEIERLRERNGDAKRELADIKGVLANVPCMNFLRQYRHNVFQLQGAYDGAMSEDCKQSFRDDYAIIDSLVKELELA